MSYMSALERHARRAVAMSMLNDLRRHGEQQHPLDWDEADRSIFLDAIEFSQADRLPFKMLRYSFQGMGKNNEAAALQLFRALSAALTDLVGKDRDRRSAYIVALKDLSESQQTPDDSERRLAIELIETAMDKISDETQGENRARAYGTGI